MVFQSTTFAPTAALCYQNNICISFFSEFVISVEESCFALTEDGRVFAWGFNSSGQLGIGNTATITTPQLIHVTGGVKISQLAAGYTHTLALAMHTGQVFAWGWNGYGQLGQENFNDRNEPGNVELNPDIKIKQISCSGDGSFALTQCGEVRFLFRFSTN